MSLDTLEKTVDTGSSRGASPPESSTSSDDLGNPDSIHPGPTHGGDVHDHERHDGGRQIRREAIKAICSDPTNDLPHRVKSRDSTGKTVISWEPNDPEDPDNWSMGKKFFCLFVAIATVANSTIASSLASGTTEAIRNDLHVTSKYLLVLPTSIFLVGYIVGPFVWGPLSEAHGRKWVMLSAFFLYSVFSAATAGAPNFAGLVVFRFFAGVGGSCPIAVVGGICADIYHDPAARGRAMAVFMAVTTFGPILGPIISGFVSVISWRWTFGCGSILAAVTWIPLLLYPETYGPVLLAHRAKRLREEHDDPNIVAPIELEKVNFAHVIQVVLTRPARMLMHEPIVNLSCLYVSVAYGVFYIFFQSYPLIFGGIYGFNPGEQGLAFIPIGIGAVIACVMYLYYDSYFRKAQLRSAPWALDEEYRRLPLACAAGPFFVVSFFWMGWTADPPGDRPPVHWLSPVAAGIPYGVGYLLIFMALLNYLVDAYGFFAASAMAATLITRSTFGAVLPFAASPMYERLGINWACSLLGFLAMALCVVPFVFIRFGARIRARSPFCQFLARKKLEDAEKMERKERRRRLMAGGGGGGSSSPRDEEEAVESVAYEESGAEDVANVKV